jgi:aspartyl protease family protein
MLTSFATNRHAPEAVSCWFAGVWRNGRELEPRMRNTIILIVAGCFVAGIGGKMAKQFDAKASSAPSSRATETPRPIAASGTASLNTLVVPRDRTGHFRVNANIGSSNVEFLVDTGASIIALTDRDADRLGIKPSPKDYRVQIQTANGVARAARVRLASVRLGELTVQDVDAVVMPRGALNENLLGMSFLSRIRRFEFRTGQLVLEQ